MSKVGGAIRLSAVDVTAKALGLVPGMTLADARARIPEVRTEASSPQADAALLDHVLHDFGRFTPMSAVDGPDGLIMDVTGCTHLFDGEDGVVRAVADRVSRIGLTARLALAGSPQAARVLARFSAQGIVQSSDDRARVRSLPVAALELSDRETEALRRAGLKTIADVDDRPRSPLAARFGGDFPTRLDRILGLEDTRITPHRPPASVTADRLLLEPIMDGQHIETVVGELLEDVARSLEARSLGGRCFALALFRVDGEVRWIEVRASRASRDRSVVARLFRERLSSLANPLNPGFGFDHFRMEVVHVETLLPDQATLEASPSQSLMFDALTDRLRARLGDKAVLRMEPVESHLPERNVHLAPVAHARDPVAKWPDRERGSPPLRPFHLFDPPQPIDAIALAPDGPPARFKWRRVNHQVTRAEGPERIEGEWWRRPRHRTRDYYRVEDDTGRRFWIFRAGHYGSTPEPRWYLHGLFA